MDDRYEIRGKVGQGGIGSVHRAYDHKLKREVAIKRILTSEEDPDLEEEATKQMIAEARALASLQHPHIVTILDVGSDSKGPYVVMELLTGNTLDELIEKSPLTWDDFKEIATQSLEALIAAQELGMIHSDLKPPNIMLTWLPSGKFQVKVLDFGLAVLIQSQSKEEIEKMESVFGSIFFMPPEQFERETLDERSDLYSLGCCFYQALAGAYPFSGEDGEQVMEAHLNHTVIPIGEVRQDIPEWAAQWVMWLINRDRDERPATARDALANFLENERAEQEAKNRPKGPKRLVSSTATGPVPTATGPHATASATSSVSLPEGPEGAGQESSSDESRRKLAPKLIKVAVVAVLGCLFCVLLWWAKQRTERIQSTKAYTDLVAKASNDGVTQILIDGDKLRKVLEGLGNLGDEADLDAASNALLKVEVRGGGNTDLIVAEFATQAELPDPVRRMLFREVLSMRGEEVITPLLLEYAASTSNTGMATAALAAADGLVDVEHAGAILGIMTEAADAGLLDAGSQLMREIISWSEDHGKLVSQIEGALKKAQSEGSKKALGELLARAKEALRKSRK